jgi:hypothetical protein
MTHGAAVPAEPPPVGDARAGRLRIGGRPATIMAITWQWLLIAAGAALAIYAAFVAALVSAGRRQDARGG